MQEQIGIPACFSAGENDSATITRSGQNVFMSVYRTKLADQCRLITVTWCKNLLLHGLSISVDGGGDRDTQSTCKIELKPWYFWRKHGSKRFAVEGKAVDVFWDLKIARFNGETEPISDYYVAVVFDGEVVLLLGNLRKEAFRKTGCRPSLIDPILISRKEHIFGKRKFTTRLKFHDKGSLHEISIECKNRGGGGGVEPEMEIRIDGHLVIHVKHLQWKFRGNELIHLNKAKIEVYWDVHDWLFSPGLRHALFIFKPTLLAASKSSPLSGPTASGSPDFCLFLYAWKVE
ncbi:uncharacterized protein LOC131023259 [Salvia miltiorrhiza]|uniref:uncharacterized protein LOC131023259 n=1 Tax=Salvia miltiorrhiza TaxID=226208 RepID=UPI0025AC8E52|nr:uncharacterized protein LOC131023259 [Salvia miltiorrhiza]